jgi:hypothetical protein
VTVSAHEPAREVGLPVCNGLNGLDGRECRHDGDRPVCDGQFTGHRGVDCTEPAKGSLAQAPSVTVSTHSPAHEIGWPVCDGLNGVQSKDCRHEGDLPECDDKYTGRAGTACKPKAAATLSQQQIDADLFNWSANALIGAPVCNGVNGKEGVDCTKGPAAAQLI